MTQKVILKFLLAILCLPVTSVLAKDRTEIEAFIMHVRETNSFVPVSNIWQADNNFDQKDLLKNVEKAQPLSIDYMNVATFMKQRTTAISLIVPGIGGGSYTIDMARYDFLTNDFQVHEMGANNTDKRVDYQPGLYYRGVVNGIPGSVAAFSFFNNEIYGVFSIPGEGNYVIEPNTMVGKEYDHNQHYLLYNDADLKIKPQGPGCSADQLPDIKRTANKTTTTLNNNVYNSCVEVNCFETADFAMYQKKGTSTTNATNYITAIFNNKSTLYRNESILINLKYVQINTATDQYATLPTSSTSSGRWLNKFGWVTQGTMHGCDIATLFSTKGGSMGGVAWLGLLCAGYFSSDSAGPYAFCNINNTTSLTLSAFPTFTWDVEVATHEMGHGVGSPHTHRCCWGPMRTTAIDGCYTIEGSCPDPGDPPSSIGGTIMSYCHLTSSTIKFNNGFGQQPGDTVRYFLSHTLVPGSCGDSYNPSVAVSRVNRTVAANRECTDMDGITYYWKDNNTADHADDTVVLMIAKNGNNIGNLNTATFSVTASTIAGYGAGMGDTITFPAATAGITASHSQYAMRRYWKITPGTEPTSAVEVIFPFLDTDTSDVNGSVPGATTNMTSYKMYKVNSPVDPNPANNFPSATSSSFSIYTYGATASTSNWSLSNLGTTNLAHMKMTRLGGGGSGFYSYSPSGVDEYGHAGNGITIYPNPANSEWNVSVARSNSEALVFSLYSADGRMVRTQTLDNNGITTIQAASLPEGIYFYRIIGGSGVLTGNLVKN